MPTHHIWAYLSCIICLIFLPAAQEGYIVPNQQEECSPLAHGDVKLLFNFKHDDKVWVFDEELKDTYGQVTQFFYPKGQDENAWTERLTVHFWDPMDSKGLRDYYQSFRNYTLSSHPEAKLYSRIINKDKKNLFFEWELIDANQESCHEWFKMMSAPHHTIAIRYCTKDLSQTEQKRAKWENALCRAKIHRQSFLESENTSLPKLEDSCPSNSLSLLLFNNTSIHASYFVPRNWRLSPIIPDKKNAPIRAYYHEDTKQQANFTIRLLEPSHPENHSKSFDNRANTLMKKTEFGKLIKCKKLPANMTPNAKRISLFSYAPMKNQKGQLVRHFIVLLEQEHGVIQVRFCALDKAYDQFETLFDEVYTSIRLSKQNLMAFLGPDLSSIAPFKKEY